MDLACLHNPSRLTARPFLGRMTNGNNTTQHHRATNSRLNHMFITYSPSHNRNLLTIRVRINNSYVYLRHRRRQDQRQPQLQTRMPRLTRLSTNLFRNLTTTNIFGILPHLRGSNKRQVRPQVVPYHIILRRRAIIPIRSNNSSHQLRTQRRRAITIHLINTSLHPSNRHQPSHHTANKTRPLTTIPSTWNSNANNLPDLTHINIENRSTRIRPIRPNRNLLRRHKLQSRKLCKHTSQVVRNVIHALSNQVQCARQPNSFNYNCATVTLNVSQLPCSNNDASTSTILTRHTIRNTKVLNTRRTTNDAKGADGPTGAKGTNFQRTHSVRNSRKFTTHPNVKTRRRNSHFKMTYRFNKRVNTQRYNRPRFRILVIRRLTLTTQCNSGSTTHGRSFNNQLNRRLISRIEFASPIRLVISIALHRQRR